MKKHLYFFISSIISILLCIYSIVTSDQIVKETLESVKMLPESFQDRVYQVYSNNGNTYVYIIAGISILISLLMIISILKKRVTKRKFIILSIISILFSPIDLIMLISILNLVLCITIKNDINKPSKEIPILEINRNKKYIIKSIILILAYLSQYLLRYIPGDKFIISVCFEIVLLILAIILFFDLLKKEFIIFKNKFSEYFNYILPKLGIGYLIYMAVTLICTSITKETTSVNQQALEQMNIIYVSLAAVIWAPIVEETIFRRCIRNFIKNDLLFIIISGIIFGLLHTIHEATILNVILMGLPYMVLGGYLAYIYTKTNNMLSNIMSHALINSLALIIMILL